MGMFKATLNSLINEAATALKEKRRAARGYRILALRQTAPILEPNNLKPRLTFLLPFLSHKKAFGGVDTAIRFYKALVPENIDARIVIINEDPRDHFEAKRFPDHQPMLVTAEKSAHRTIVYLNACAGALLLRPNDVFISTNWSTAVMVQELQRQQRIAYGKEQPNCYLIQDFEPSFHAFSSDYVLAESTYRSEMDTIPVFNTEFLANFFRSHGYAFGQSFIFEPIINGKMTKYLPQVDNIQKKCRLLVYGRSAEPRNAFELIVAGLRLWSDTYPNAANWELVSLGGKHKDVKLEKGCVLLGKGKVSLDEYADYLCTSALGLSLMISPHPSYPPLEMTAFGLGVLTNNFDVKVFPKGTNLNALGALTPQTIAEQLAWMCDRIKEDPRYFVNLRDAKNRFIETQREEFPFLEELAAQLFSKP